MIKFQALDVNEKHKILSILLDYSYQKRISISGNYEQSIKEYIQILKKPNILNIEGIISKAENVNCVINSIYWLDISPTEGSYVTPLQSKVVAIIFDDNIITSELMVSPFRSCVILTK